MNRRAVAILEGISETLGKVAERLVFYPAWWVYAHKMKGIPLQIAGIEHIQEIVTQPSVIIALNHVGPVPHEGTITNSGGLTPDIMLITETVHKLAKHYPKVIAINNADWWIKLCDDDIKNITWKCAKHMILTAFLRGFLTGRYSIPVDKSSTHNLNDFIKQTDDAAKKHVWMTFFVEGIWRSPDHDYSKEICVKSGAACVAIKNNLPILPVYIYCSDDWKVTKPATIAFGAPIYPQGSEKSEVSQAIAQDIIQLQVAYNTHKMV